MTGYGIRQYHFFIAYFFGSLGYCAVFCLLYAKMTSENEFDLFVHKHNASAGLAFGGALLGFAIALTGAIQNTESASEFMLWGGVAMVSQLSAYGLARLFHPGLSQAIKLNAVASAI